MNVRFKPYITIQETVSDMIISGLRNGLRFEKKTSQLVDILSKLKSEEGVGEEECDAIKAHYQWITDDLLETAKETRAVNRASLFYDYLQFDLNSILDRNILVFGAGAAGGTITYLLAQHGFKHIFLLDYDKVEVSDVLKTMVYDIEDLGEKKSVALQRRICRNFGIQISIVEKRLWAIEDAIDVFKWCRPAAVVYAIDPDSNYKLLINQYCVYNSIPIIHASYSYENIMCGPCVIPGETACFCGYNEFWKAKTKGQINYESMHRLFTGTTIHPSISYNINLLSSIIVKDLVFLLGGSVERITTKNKILRINMIDNELEEDILSCKFCHSCGAKTKE